MQVSRCICLKLRAVGMHMKSVLAFIVMLCVYSNPASAGIAWQPWSMTAFSEAKASRKPVFLYLEATWCHWCHVMQATTFENVAVQRVLARDYVVLRVDHDANPLLANRYRDYGWPALIFYAPDGQEIVKRAGYVESADFLRLLEAIVKDPTPETQAPRLQTASTAQLSAAQRTDLLARHRSAYDDALGGLRIPQKYLERDSVEYDLLHADDAAARRRATQTLTAAQALIDPAWGGMYQYSTHGNWAHPHYEKLMRTQAGALRLYALAYRKLQRAQDRRTADSVRDYLFKFLRDRESGAFYVSQDADLKPGQKSAGYFALGDAARRKLGLPRVDRNLYSDANGLAAEALALHALYTQQPGSLDAAISALDWVLQHRQGPLGGLRHGAKAEAVEYLSDNLAVAQAALVLYRATAERRWLAQAQRLADHMASTFTLTEGGLASASPHASVLPPLPVLAENLGAARFFDLMHAYSGQPAHRAAAESALRWAIASDAAHPAIDEAGLLLAAEDMERPPLHLTVVGSKKDPQAQALYRVAAGVPASHLRVEWLDAAEGPLANQDVQYPKLQRAAGFSCEANRCSAPRFTPEDYSAAIERLSSKR